MTNEQWLNKVIENVASYKRWIASRKSYLDAFIDKINGKSSKVKIETKVKFNSEGGWHD